MPYVVQTWCFGDDMAMVFLAGEVVVDYALRLKWEIDAERLWVAAYSNDVPCYIPSRRVLSEGGYEADFSMIYYGHPSRLAPATEDLIIQTVHALLPAPFDGPRKPIRSGSVERRAVYRYGMPDSRTHRWLIVSNRRLVMGPAGLRQCSSDKSAKAVPYCWW